MELGKILEILSRHGHALLLVFLSFPLCLPVGIPVLSTTLGLSLAFIGLLLCIGEHLRLPRYLAARTIPYKRLLNVIERLIRVADRMERLFHPRLLPVAMNTKLVRIHGLFAISMGLLAAVPLPLPLNNMVAAMPILLLGFSLLEKDGVMVITSYVAAIPCFLYYGTLTYVGYAGFQRLIGMV